MTKRLATQCSTQIILIALWRIVGNRCLPSAIVDDKAFGICIADVRLVENNACY